MRQFNQLSEVKGLDLNTLNQAVYLPMFTGNTWKTRQYALEGYRRNVIAFRCIEEIARAASDIIITPTLNGEPLEEGSNDDFRRLFDMPSPMMEGSTLVGHMMRSYLWSGNVYLVGIDGVFNPSTGRYDVDTSVPSRKLPASLQMLKPYEVHVKTYSGNDYKVERYEHKPDDDGVQRNYPVDPVTNLSRICHIHTYNPNNPCIGMSPLEAAAYNLDIHNKGSRWNISLLDNSCAPSGIFKTEQPLTPDAISRFITQIKDFFSGSKNAGRTMVLEQGLEYQQLGLSPKDMDFISSLDTSARNIASAFGVPFALILPESSTYNNQRDARVSLYENTVIPVLSDILDGFAAWVSTITGKNYGFDIDLDSISALEEKRQIRFDRMATMVQTGILTANEAREELGYEVNPEMDKPDPEPEPVPPQDEEAAMKRLEAMYNKCKRLDD